MKVPETAVPAPNVAADGGVGAGTGGRTVITTVSPALSRFAGSFLLMGVICVPPFDQNASNGSIGGETVVPVRFELSNIRTDEPVAIGLRVPAFQSAILSSFASWWHTTIQLLALTTAVTASFQAFRNVFPSASRVMNELRKSTL